MHDCPGCQKLQISNNTWCHHCFNILVKIPNLSNEVLTPFAYEEPLKTALILYKSTGSRIFEKALGEALFSVEESWSDSVKWCDLIVFAPQSLSSFLQLKSNAAMLLAQFMSKKHSKTINQGISQFSFKKQTSKKRVNLHDELIQLTRKEGSRNILIVDDVLSSGQTLCTLSKHLSENNLRYFCLMRSRAMDIQKKLKQTL